MKYRLTWQKDTPLDLSQILDTRGRPVIFTGKNTSVIIDGITYTHPLIQKYCGKGINAEIIDLIPLTHSTVYPPTLSSPTANLAHVVYKKINEPYLKGEPSNKESSTKEIPNKAPSLTKKYYRSKRIKHS